METITDMKIDSHADPSTASHCAYELGIIAEIQVAETVERNNNINIALNATYLDAEQVKEVHINFSGKDGRVHVALVLLVGIMAGGTTQDYVDHICTANRDFT